MGFRRTTRRACPSSDFSLTIEDPPPCTVGFLPPSQWRNPADTTSIDTPDGLYCKLPQDSPISVRGARNYPCIGHPGKRAPTVELCNDPSGSSRPRSAQHVLGPYPFDPNLVAQGIPPDDRVDFNERIYAPVEGTPLPPGAVPVGSTPRGRRRAHHRWVRCPGPPPAAPMPAAPPPPPGNSLNGVPIPAAPPAVPPPGDGAVPAAPSAFNGNASGGPSVAVAHYDPHTGEYMTPDGQMQQVRNLADGGVAEVVEGPAPVLTQTDLIRTVRRDR